VYFVKWVDRNGNYRRSKYYESLREAMDVKVQLLNSDSECNPTVYLRPSVGPTSDKEM
jgi:hypothetical protein